MSLPEILGCADSVSAVSVANKYNAESGRDNSLAAQTAKQISRRYTPKTHGFGSKSKFSSVNPR